MSRIARAWAQARANDLRDLPHAGTTHIPGPYGDRPERTRQGGPEAPPLTSGPLYTGEWREQINGDPLDVPDAGDAPFVILATLRRPWPYVGFAIDTSQVPAGHTVKAGLLIYSSSGPAALVANVQGGAPAPVPQIDVTTPAPILPWLAMTGILAGARVSLYVTQSNGDHPAAVTIAGNLWGYNAPGYGP